MFLVMVPACSNRDPLWSDVLCQDLRLQSSVSNERQVQYTIRNSPSSPLTGISILAGIGHVTTVCTALLPRFHFEVFDPEFRRGGPSERGEQPLRYHSTEEV